MIGAPGRRVRRLKEPRLVQVRTDAHDIPLAVMSSSPIPETPPDSNDAWRRVKSPNKLGADSWQPLSLLRRPWRIDQLWWRPGEAVSRRYFQAAPEDGPPMTLYQDLLTGRWYRQEY